MIIRLEKADINYEIIGEGMTLLIIHGFYLDHEVMKRFVEPVLELKYYQRVYIDLPGMGLSTNYNRIKNSEDMLDMLTEFVQKVIGTKEFIGIGYSFGGYLLMHMTKRLKDQMRGAFFICPIVEPKYDKRILPEHKNLDIDESLLEAVDDSKRELYLSLCVRLNPRIKRTIDHVMNGARNHADESFIEEIRLTGYGCEAYEEHHYEKPVTFFLGRFDTVAGYQNALNVAARFGRATYVILDHAGHLAPIEQEHLFRFHLVEWLERIEKDRGHIK